MNFKPILFHVESIGDLTPNLFSFFLIQTLPKQIDYPVALMAS